MSDDYKRPNPDELLARIKAEEQQQARGRLKIFLGYAAGVGKTYAMLEAAHQRKAEGVDVVIGYAETHGRKETEAYLKGLEILPCQQVKYRGKTLSELDLDAVLARKPQLVLIDELAHTNTPGLRHPKRHQDVEEILSAGIDVYTTVNVQHLESLNDVIQQITGVVVKETVPDRLIDEAYEIELIDLPADELLRRLHDGKVYVPDQALQALENFFRKGNLTALRELSLRRVAERVDNQMLNYMQTKSIPGPWPASERILVCISPHPMAERLIRVGRRLADDLNAEWSVIFVETPGHLSMSAENRTRIQRNLHLAEELGATVVNLTSNSVADTVIRFAREHNITKIIAGKPLRPRWLEIIRGTVLDEIIRNSGKIDVYVVSGSTIVPKVTTLKSLTPHSPIRDYIFSLTLVFLATLAAKPLASYLDPTNLVMLYLLAVILAAIFLGRWPAILASFVSVFAFDYFYVEPQLSFSVTDTQYLITFGGLLLVGLFISNSAAVLRNKVDILRVREQQAEALNTLSRELTGAISLEDVLHIVNQNVSEMFNREVVILLPENETLIQRVSTPGFIISETELAVADWAFKKGQATGRGTDTLTAATIRYLPLKTARGTVGILGVRPHDLQDVLSIDQRMLLEGFVNLAALAIERASFAEKIAQTDMLHKTEKLQTALLNSISHELRTPLASITGVLTSLGESEKTGNRSLKLDPTTRRELIESATQQAKRLNHLVENLLDMTRLEAGALRLNFEPGDMEDLIGTVLNQMSERLSNHPVKVNIPSDFPLVPMDIVLIAQVMTNLLDNACKYSLPGSPIEIIVTSKKDQIAVSFRDFGSGIPPTDLNHVFDKFYRVHQQNQIAGTGLGLSICKGIIEAHGGQIWAENNTGKGVTVTFALPILSKG